MVDYWADMMGDRMAGELVDLKVGLLECLMAHRLVEC